MRPLGIGLYPNLEMSPGLTPDCPCSSQFLQSSRVPHILREEYVRGHVTTNTVEGFFSIFKRGMKGIYQHCGEAHLHRYLAEFDFRYSYRVKLGYSDTDRAKIALKGIEGKRLMYLRPAQG